MKYSQEEIEGAVDIAISAFWSDVALSFPKITDGDFDVREAVRFEKACKNAVEKWLEFNDDTILLDIYDGLNGDSLLCDYEMSEEYVIQELKKGNAVELYYKGNRNPVAHYYSEEFETDEDGFCRLIQNENDGTLHV